jgi:O-succinylhomoserine sulfhydrylase
MAAVFTSLAAILRAGDRVVSSRALFGSCFVILDELLPRWGIETVFVDGHVLEQWEEALSRPAAAVFFESPSNPMQDLVDVAAVCTLAHAAGRPGDRRQRLRHAAAAAPAGARRRHRRLLRDQAHRRAGPGAGRRDPRPEEYIDEKVQLLMRHTGPSMSPFNAWVLLKGLETLRLRVDRQCDVALRVAEWLERHPRVRSVRYPSCPATRSTTSRGGR